MFGKKKNKYYGQDSDKDGYDDGLEVEWKRHSEDNKPRHITVGGTLPSRNGIIGIHHEGLKSSVAGHTGKKGRLKLNINGPKPMKLTADMKSNTIYKMKEIKIPKAELAGTIKNFPKQFAMDYVDNHIRKILRKRLKK